MEVTSFETDLTVESVAKYFVVSKKRVRDEFDTGVLPGTRDDDGTRTVQFCDANNRYPLRPEWKKKFAEQSGTDKEDVPERRGGEIEVKLVRLEERLAASIREMEIFRDQTEFLKKELVQANARLTDQRSKEEKEAERFAEERARAEIVDRKLDAVRTEHEKELTMLKRQNQQIMRELRESRMSLWDRIFGRSSRGADKAGQSKKAG